MTKKDMLSFLIARDTMHQQQWLAAIEELGDTNRAAPNDVPDERDYKQYALRVRAWGRVTTPTCAPSEAWGQACAATSRTSTSSSLTPSGTFALIRSLAPLAASSDSKMTIDKPVLPFRVQCPVTNPGACDTAGTVCSRSAVRAASGSLMVTLTTTACIAAFLCRLDPSN